MELQIYSMRFVLHFTQTDFISEKVLNMRFCNLNRSFKPVYSGGIMAVAGPAGNDKIEKA